MQLLNDIYPLFISQQCTYIHIFLSLSLFLYGCQVNKAAICCCYVKIMKYGSFNKLVPLFLFLCKVENLKIKLFVRMCYGIVKERSIFLNIYKNKVVVYIIKRVEMNDVNYFCQILGIFCFLLVQKYIYVQNFKSISKLLVVLK